MSPHSTPGFVLENHPLAPCTTLGVGGPARFFIEAHGEEQVLHALELAQARNWPVFVLGGGSNLLISDDGFPGLVLQIRLRGIRFENESCGMVTAAAGEDWDAFVSRCVDQNFAGVECLSGIPGTVGGTPIQNVGAYGQEVSETIVAVRALDRGNQTIRQLVNSACRFSYRSSVFNTDQRDRYIVLSVSFILRRGGQPCLRYADLQGKLTGRPNPPSVADVRQAVLEIRARKAMLLRPDDPDSRSAGSFFKNVLVSDETARGIDELARRSGHLAAGETLPRFAAAEGMFKLSAAWLVEHAGFPRGYNRGAVGLSSKHALAIINRGGAKARDVLDLMGEIQHGVLAAFGVELMPEPVFVGF